jgi:hypothetical protein
MARKALGIGPKHVEKGHITIVYFPTDDMVRDFHTTFARREVSQIPKRNSQM